MKNILIAGGTDGIGLAFVKQLKANLYEKIFVLGRDFSKLENIHIPQIVHLRCDITDQDAIKYALQLIDQPLDQFVNTIGTFYRNPIDRITAMLYNPRPRPHISITWMRCV